MKQLAFVFSLISTSHFLGAQTLQVGISTQTPAVNELLSIQYVFDGGNLPMDILPKVNGMMMLGVPTPMSGSNSFNGVNSTYSQLTYEIVFTKAGTFIIPPVTVKTKKGRFSCEPITLKVKKGAGSGSIIPPGYEGKEVVIVMEQSKKQAYLGECVSLDLVIYAYTDNVSVEGVELPKFDDGWVQDIKGPKGVKFEKVMYEGRPYCKTKYAKIWLVPFKTGEAVYEPARVVMSTYVKLVGGNDADQFGFQRDEISIPFDKMTNKVVFDIKDLPQEQQPESFVNALGKFTLKVSLDKINAKANEPIKAKFLISGTGNFPILDGPDLNLPNHFETFEPKVKNGFQILSDGITGSKEFEYYIVPRKEGNYQLGPFAFSYFDVDEKKFVELRSDSFQIAIKGMIADTTKGTMTINNGIFTDEKPYKKSEPFFGNPFYYVILGLPFILAFGFIIFRKKIFFTKKDDSEKKLKQAEDRAYKSLQEIKVILDGGDSQKALSLLSEVFFQYISDKFKTSKNEITRANLEKWPDLSLKMSAIKILDQLDQFRFAPAAQSDLNTLYVNIKNFVDELGGK